MDKQARPGLWLIGLIVVALLAVAASWWWDRQETEPADEAAQVDEAPEPVIRESAVQPGQQVLVLQGQWRARPYQAVRMPAAGAFSWTVEDDAIVEEGDVLGRTASGALQARLGQAQAQMNVARQQVRALRQLVAGGYEPEERLAAAEAAFAGAEKDLAAAEQAIETTRLRAPVGGRIRFLTALPDELAEGAEIARIFTRDPLQITVRVPEEHAAAVQTGSLARADIPGIGALEGRVVSVGKQDRQQREVSAHIELPNPDHAHPARSSVEVRIAL